MQYRILVMYIVSFVFVDKREQIFLSSTKSGGDDNDTHLHYQPRPTGLRQRLMIGRLQSMISSCCCWVQLLLNPRMSIMRTRLCVSFLIFIDQHVHGPDGCCKSGHASEHSLANKPLSRILIVSHQERGQQNWPGPDY